MKTKYFNDAIIGNKNVRATFSKKGELLRLYYPSIDYRQFIDELMVGLKINDSRLINLYNDINNVYSQNYIEDTNIINTEIKNTYFNLKIIQTDFVPIKENILVRKYVLKNEHEIPLDVNLLVYSKLLTDKNNTVSGLYKNDSLMQYMHDYTLSIFSKQKPLSYQINNCNENLSDGEIGGKDYIGMSIDSSISYNVGTLNPGEQKEICVIMSIHDNKTFMDKIDEDIIRIKKLDFNKEEQDTEKYWKNYLKKHDTIELKAPKNEKEQKIRKIYRRTILLFPLLYNEETGGISAAAEVDEERSKCGGYSYCWPRDAIFITKAMFKLNMNKEVEKFYKVFCKNTQSREGMWEQRFYTDGSLAPSWGYQIDETAAVIYGVYDYYKKSQDVKFLKDNAGKKGKGGTRYQNSQFYFREGFCWTDIHTTYVKSRLKENGVYDVKSMSLFSLTEKTPDWYIVCLLNSKYISEYIDDFINCTQTFQINDARVLPIIIPTENQLKNLQLLFKKAIQIKKDYFNKIINKKDMDKKLQIVQNELDQEIYKLYNIKI